MTSEALLLAYGVALATLEDLLIPKGVLEPGGLPLALQSMAQVTPGKDAVAARALPAWAEMLEDVDATQAGLQ